MPVVINRLVSVPKSNYMTYRFHDVIHHFTLSADDVGPQQNPESQRTSYVANQWSVTDENINISFYQ